MNVVQKILVGLAMVQLVLLAVVVWFSNGEGTGTIVIGFFVCAFLAWVTGD